MAARGGKIVPPPSSIRLVTDHARARLAEPPPDCRRRRFDYAAMLAHRGTA
jgi:hypothetical protein